MWERKTKTRISLEQIEHELFVQKRKKLQRSLIGFFVILFPVLLANAFVWLIADGEVEAWHILLSVIFSLPLLFSAVFLYLDIRAYLDLKKRGIEIVTDTLVLKEEREVKRRYGYAHYRVLGFAVLGESTVFDRTVYELATVGEKYFLVTYAQSATVLRYYSAERYEYAE